MGQFLRSFGFGIGVSFIALAAVLSTLGLRAAFIASLLAVIELAFSVDNAVINAHVLMRLSSFWQNLFIGVGIVIAIVGTRVLLPILIVSLTTHLSLAAVVDLASRHPEMYARGLASAQPNITAFGGAFLMMLSLHFFMADHDVLWWRMVERPLSKLVRWWLPAVIVMTIIFGLAVLPFNLNPRATVSAGLIGVLLYGFMHGVTTLIDAKLGRGAIARRTGWVAFVTFLYLELLDASLSFDSVIGAFVITNQVILITVGLGIGAFWVRSLTIYMVRRQAFETYRYLEHGAHYAIAVLAAAMLLETIIDVPNLLLGFTSLGLIAASFLASRRAHASSRPKKHAILT